MNTDRRFLLLALAALPLAARAQAPAPAPVRLRGTIEALSPTRLTLRQRNGERIELAIAPNLTVSEVYPVTLADIQAGSFVGVGAIPQADGTQRAIAVTLFPQGLRSNEGHYPFDFVPQGTMTNATVTEVAVAPDGQRLQLTYPEGRKTIVVPPEAPVVSFRPSDRGLLAVGSAVSLSALPVDGQPTATRISAGRNGFAPPY